VVSWNGEGESGGESADAVCPRLEGVAGGNAALLCGSRVAGRDFVRVRVCVCVCRYQELTSQTWEERKTKART
jgi:hypothetical protein